MSYSKYRFADLTVFSLLALLTSFISEYAYIKLSNPMFYLNFGLLISTIAIVRWNHLGAITYVVAGIPMLLMRTVIDAYWVHFGFYVVANLFVGGACLVFKFIDKQRISSSISHTLLYLFSAFLFVAIAKGFILAISGDNFLISVYSYLVAELFNMVITVIAFVFINRFGKGLIVDMYSYILDAQKETIVHD